MNRFLRKIILFSIIVSGALSIASTAKAATSENLILNANLEQQSASSTPVDWIKGHWGENAEDFNYPVAGPNGPSDKAAEVHLTSRTSGDAKWAFNLVTPVAGKTYEYSDFYKADVPTFITVEYLLTNGTYRYDDIAKPQPSSSWKSESFQFTIPQNVSQMRVFHLINQLGTLDIDQTSLGRIENLVANSNMADWLGTGSPTLWNPGQWGTNNATFSYNQNARVDITSYTSGDAKWWFPEVSVKPGEIYTFADSYRSNVTTFITVQYRRSDGTLFYQDIGTANPSSTMTQFKTSFIVPGNVVSLTVFHVINTIGYLETNNVSMTLSNSSQILIQVEPGANPNNVTYQKSATVQFNGTTVGTFSIDQSHTDQKVVDLKLNTGNTLKVDTTFSNPDGSNQIMCTRTWTAVAPNSIGCGPIEAAYQPATNSCTMVCN